MSCKPKRQPFLMAGTKQNDRLKPLSIFDDGSQFYSDDFESEICMTSVGTDNSSSSPSKLRIRAEYSGEFHRSVRLRYYSKETEVGVGMIRVQKINNMLFNIAY